MSTPVSSNIYILVFINSDKIWAGGRSGRGTVLLKILIISQFLFFYLVKCNKQEIDTRSCKYKLLFCIYFFIFSDKLFVKSPLCWSLGLFCSTCKTQVHLLPRFIQEERRRSGCHWYNSCHSDSCHRSRG